MSKAVSRFSRMWLQWFLIVALLLGRPNLGSQLGLSVGADGALMKDGKAYRGIGANYFDLFSRTLVRPEDASSLSNLAALARAETPFVGSCAAGSRARANSVYS